MKKILASALAAIIPTVCFATVTVTKSGSGRLFDNQGVQYMPGVGMHSSNEYVPLKLDADGKLQTSTSDSALSLVSTQTVSPGQSAVYIDTGDGIQVKAAPLMGITSTGDFYPILVDGSGKVITSGGGGGGTITGVTAGTGLTGGGVTGNVTVNADVGTTANKILQLNGSAQIPAVSGALLTNLNGSNISSGTVATARLDAGTSANQLVQLNGSSQLPAVSGALVTNLNGSAIASGTVPTARLDTGTTAGKVVVLDGSAKLPAVDASQLLNVPAGTPSGVVLYKEFTYDFSVQGGSIGTKTLSGGQIPANSLFVNAYFVTLTTLTSSGTPTLSLNCGSANLDPSGGIADISFIFGGLNTLGGQLSILKTTSACDVTLGIADAALTAGKARVVVQYNPYTP